MATSETTRPSRYLRFTLSDRIEHWVQVVAFVALAVTGLVQRYDGAALSKAIISGLGGIETIRIIHRVFATVLMVAVVYHFGAAGYRWYVRREPRSMIPGKRDLTAIGRSLAHTFGLRRHPPEQGRYTWEEKLEYWALVWGTLVMIITGFLLWNPIATTTILPGEFIPAAKAAHSGEALLAVLAVVVWHMYHVHVRNWNTSMFTGYLSRELMEEEHPLELARIEAGEYQEPTPAERRERLKRFLPAYGVVAALLLGGIWVFVSFENTAIATISPPEQVEIFAPVETSGTTTTTAPPATTTTTAGGGTTTTTGAAGPITWEGTVAALFADSCAMCHGAGGSAGLDLTSYAGILAGGASGPGIVPGDPAAGTVVAKMSGAHPAVLEDGQLAVVADWIAAGAPETEDDIGAPVTTTTAPAAEIGSWDETFGPLFGQRCTSCHGGDEPVGGLSLETYEALLAGTEAAPVVVSGDPESSSLFLTMASGDHFSVLSGGDLESLRLWIAAGVPETAADAAAATVDDEGAGETTTTSTTTASEDGGAVWSDIATLFAPCAGCHSAAQATSGLDLSTYEAAVTGGSRGPGIVPGDPDGSVIVQIMEAGGHPVQLSAEDLATLRDWIAAGAPDG